MNTFLIDTDFLRTGMILDSSRLGNQCWREDKTLVNGGWPHHPASKMWQGYEKALCHHGLAMALAMQARRMYKPETRRKWAQYWLDKGKEFPDTGEPPWLGDERIYASHRGVLLAKGMIDVAWAELRAQTKNSAAAWDVWHGLGLPRKSKKISRAEFDVLCGHLGRQITVEDSYYSQFEWGEDSMFAIDGRWPYYWPVA